MTGIILYPAKGARYTGLRVITPMPFDPNNMRSGWLKLQSTGCDEIISLRYGTVARMILSGYFTLVVDGINIPRECGFSLPSTGVS